MRSWLIATGKSILSKASVYEAIALSLCILLGAAIIANNGMGGEAMWFWYATVFHRGAHLYAGLHIALQPFFIIFTDAWMSAFGQRLWTTQLAPLLEVVAMGVSLLLILRESPWPPLPKALVLFGAFCFTVCGHSYRFDDYHVLTENLILYALLLLLVLARTHGARQQFILVAFLGLLGGLAATTRLTDGAALVGASAICLPVLLRRYRIASICLLLVTAIAVGTTVVLLTGDTVAAYARNSIFQAAQSKGGTRSIFSAPFQVVLNVVPLLLQNGRRRLAGLLLIFSTGPIVLRSWRAGVRWITLLQLAIAALLFLVSGNERHVLLRGGIISTIVLITIPFLYALTVYVLFRLRSQSSRGRLFDRREILVVLSFAEWASYSAGAAAEPITNYFAPLAILLLLFPILRPYRRPAWLHASFVTLLILLIVSTLTSKALIPYSWQNYVMAPMFQKRVLYEHPIYGTMYIEDDLLRFSQQVCSDIKTHSGPRVPQLLSLPYPYPNYFCNIPPWHNYVQTFFDTSNRKTIEGLMGELQTDPPEWIVYQRQMNIMKGAERLYNHGQPLAQRDLDRFIAGKIESGQWMLVDRSSYLGTVDGSGWFVIRTHS